MHTIHSIKLKTLIKNGILVVIAASSLYICDASARVSIGFGFGGPAYYPEPYPDVTYVPAHYEGGYYVPGQYVQYGPDYYDNDYDSGPSAVWFGFGGGGGHWHHGGGGWGGGHGGGWGGHHR